MLCRRDIEWDDEEYLRLEKDMIRKFRRLNLNDPDDHSGRFKAQAIWRERSPDISSGMMIDERLEAKTKARKMKFMRTSRKKKKQKRLESIVVYKKYDNYLKKTKFGLRKYFKPKFKKRGQIVLYRSFNLQQFIFSELIKAHQTLFN